MTSVALWSRVTSFVAVGVCVHLTARFLVPLGPRPPVLSYVSAPLEMASIRVTLVAATVFARWADRLPARVPLHWNALGEIDRWGSPTERCRAFALR
jgi:hypothetical protein